MNMYNNNIGGDDIRQDAMYQNLMQMRRTGGGRRMNIPMQRPESPNERLGRIPQGIQADLRISNGYGMEQAIESSYRNFNPGYSNDPTDRALMAGQRVSLNEINSMRSGFVGQHPVNPVMAQPVNPYQPPPVPQPMIRSNVCRLQPGSDFYRPLQLGMMQGYMKVCKPGGSVPQNWNVEFELRQTHQCYVSPLNEQSIDLERIKNSPHLQVKLVEVASMMIPGGVILVPESAIILPGQQTRTMLTDTRYQQQPQMVNPNRPPMHHTNSLYQGMNPSPVVGKILFG